MRRIFVFAIAFTISLVLSYALLATRTSEIMPGATVTKLVGRCQITRFDTRLQPMNTLVLVCPIKDMMRLWPLPMQDWC